MWVYSYLLYTLCMFTKQLSNILISFIVTDVDKQSVDSDRVLGIHVPNFSSLVSSFLLKLLIVVVGLSIVM